AVPAAPDDARSKGGPWHRRPPPGTRKRALRSAASCSALRVPSRGGELALAFRTESLGDLVHVQGTFHVRRALCPAPTPSPSGNAVKSMPSPRKLDGGGKRRFRPARPLLGDRTNLARSGFRPLATWLLCSRASRGNKPLVPPRTPPTPPRRPGS